VIIDSWVLDLVASFSISGNRSGVGTSASVTIVRCAEALSRGWETHLTIVTEALVPTPDLFPLIEKLATKSNTLSAASSSTRPRSSSIRPTLVNFVR
jgi:hypothetical protein